MIKLVLIALSIILSFLSFYYLLINYKKGVFFLLASKSIIDTSWNLKIAGFSLLQVVAVVFLVIFFIYLLRNFSRIKLKPEFIILIGLYIIAEFSSFVVSFSSAELVTILNTYTRSLYIIMAFFLFPLIVENELDFKNLLIALIIGGSIPIAFTILQSIGIDLGFTQFRQSKGLVRSVSFYHDMVQPRFYTIQAIISALLYLKYFANSKKQVISLSILVFFGFIALYFFYSKAVLAIIVVWLGLFFIFRSEFRTKYSLVLILLLIPIFIFSYSKIETQINQVYTNELAFVEGDLQNKNWLFSGRAGLWENYIDYFFNLPAEQQLIGTGISIGGVHNELLRYLIKSGYIGVTVYVLIILTITILYAINYKYLSSNYLFFSGFLLFIMFLVDNTGIGPGLYPFYMILLWGLIRLSFKLKDNVISISS